MLPRSVMTAVPFGILGALAFNLLRGLHNDVYFQIGLLVLIGLGAKNAVLRVTFAVDLRKQGLSVIDATIRAGEERLRAFADVEDAFVARQKLGDQLDAQGRLVKAFKEYERLAWLQYNGGYTPYSTVLQALQKLFPAELDWVQTRASLFVSLGNIYTSMGGGWVTLAEQQTASLPEKGGK